MAQTVSQVIPQWVKESATTLEDLYKDTLRLEYAYDYFLANYDKYRDQIAEATKIIEKAEDTPEQSGASVTDMGKEGGAQEAKKTAGGGGAIQSKLQAAEALGPVIGTGQGKSFKHEKGTNWLLAKTAWRQFGLVAGYNMQYQNASVLHLDPTGLSEAELKMIKNATIGGAVVGLIAGATIVGGAAYAGVKTKHLIKDVMNVESDQRILRMFRAAIVPRYYTGVGGSSEPGVSKETISLEDQYNITLGGLLQGAENYEAYDSEIDISAFTKSSPNKAGWQHPAGPGWSGAGDDKGGNFFMLTNPEVAGAYAHKDGSFALKHGGAFDNQLLWPRLGPDKLISSRLRMHPLFASSGLQIHNFFSATKPGPDGYGHLLSPELVWYYRLAGSQSPDGSAFGTQMAKALSGLRTQLGDRAINIVNQVNSSPVSQVEKNLKVWKSMDFLGMASNIYQKPKKPPKKYGSHGLDIPLPEQLVVWPTLPLERPFTFGKPYQWGITPEQHKEKPWRRLGGQSNSDVEDDARISINTEVREAWKKVFDGANFKSVQALMRQMNPKAKLFGAEGSEEFKKNMADQVERILDFFGAGGQDDLTEAQEREKNVTAGSSDSAPNMATINDEARKNITKFRSLKPFDYQCFLIENIGTLTDYHEKHKSYKNVMKLKGEPGETISKLQHGNRTDEVREMLNLTPAVYGVLVPYIKIWRIDYEKDGLTPLHQLEMPIPNFMDPADVTAITAGDYHRARGWGLQSFSWDLQGVQPAEVDNNISATLSFYFQSVRDLFEGSAAANTVAGATPVYAAGREKPSPLDLLIAPPTLDKIKGDKEEDDQDPEKKDTVGEGCKAKVKDQVNVAADGKYFRIKVVAGWATPERHVLAEVMPHKSPKELAALEKAITKTRIALYLQQVRHNITFNQDGSVKLSIEYQAALSGLLSANTADILGPTSPAHKAEQDRLKAKIKDAKKAKDKAIEDVPGGSEGLKAHKESDDYKKGQEEMKKLIEEQKALINEDKIFKYKRFLGSLYGRPPAFRYETDAAGNRKRIRSTTESATQGAAGTKRIYTMAVDTLELLKDPIHKVSDPEERRKRAVQRLSGTPGFTLHNDIGAGAASSLLDAINATNNAEELGTEQQKNISDTLKKDVEVRMFNDPNKILISYFYLGDLIDAILEDNATFGGKAKSNYMTFIADMDVTNPLLLYAAENSDELLCAESVDDNLLLEQLRAKGLLFQGGIKKRISIGEIPIGLDQFNIWFKNHVIKSQRNTYYLLQFIKDLCAYLVGPALKKSCFDTNVVNDIRFDTSIIHFNNKDDSGMAKIFPLHLFEGDSGDLASSQVTTDQLAKIIGETTPNNDIPSPGMTDEQKNKMDLTSALVLYCTDATPKRRSGNYEQDLGDGIYHHYLGSSVGLLKKLSFNREDQAYLREAKIQKFGALGAEQLRELYSATMDLVGNTLFKNGQYTFIWPTSMAAHQDEMARLLGLGGYFLVTGVSHKISPSGYDVQLKALQEGLALNDNPVPPKATLPESLVAEPDPEKKDGETAKTGEDPQEAVADADAASGGESGYDRAGHDARQARRDRKTAEAEAAAAAAAEAAAAAAAAAEAERISAIAAQVAELAAQWDEQQVIADSWRRSADPAAEGGILNDRQMNHPSHASRKAAYDAAKKEQERLSAEMARLNRLASRPLLRAD